MARFRVLDEAASWAGEMIDAVRSIRHRRLAVLLTWAASSAWSFARLEEARRYAEDAISLANDAAFEPFVWAFADLAMVAAYEGKVDHAIDLVRAGADHAADRRDRFCLAMCPYFLAIAGRDDEAMAAADEIMNTVEITGIPSSIAVALWAKGKAFSTSSPTIALAAYDRGFAIAH